MSFFINENEEIIVTVHSYKNGEKKRVFWTKNIADSKPSDVDESAAAVTTNTIKFKLPSYKSNLELMDAAISVDNSGKFNFSASKLAYNRFIGLLKSWDFMDDNQNQIPANEKSVLSMDNNLAQVIMKDLDYQLSL